MRFDPTDPAFVADPYPVYAELRAAGPQWCPPAGVWLIARLNQAVDELIRHDTPLSMFMRTAFDDIELGSVTVRQGERVGLLLGAANRDPDVFDRPDELDVTRQANPHVGFGAGIHYCLGAPLARLEIAEALATLLRRGRRWELAEAPELRTTWQFRGPSRLVLDLS